MCIMKRRDAQSAVSDLVIIFKLLKILQQVHLYSRFFVRSYEAHVNGMLYIGGVMTTMQGREGREGGNSSDPGSCA